MAASDSDQPLARWSAAGLSGGALAGLADAVSTVARGVGGLSAIKAGWLIALDASLLALIGLVAGALVGLGARWRAAAPPARPGRRGRGGAAAGSTAARARS